MLNRAVMFDGEEREDAIDIPTSFRARLGTVNQNTGQNEILPSRRRIAWKCLFEAEPD